MKTLEEARTTAAEAAGTQQLSRKVILELKRKMRRKMRRKPTQEIPQQLTYQRSQGLTYY